MMIYVWTMILCLTASPLFAETIGNVEYYLPSHGQGWKIGNDLQTSGNRVSTTIIYIPENASRKDSKEFFGVHTSNMQCEGFDKAILEKTMQNQFPKQQVSVNVLETDSDSVLFEWIVRQTSREKKHGWTRMFAHKSGTILLVYETLDIASVKTMGPIWVDVLKKAKLAKN
ncbi:MAG: hypothetical protein HKM07_02280 [Chlamydiae bacterium]|nr:hypothetical protein [Chlamydiota bacterium]